MPNRKQKPAYRQVVGFIDESRGGPSNKKGDKPEINSLGYPRRELEQQLEQLAGFGPQQRRLDEHEP